MTSKIRYAAALFVAFVPGFAPDLAAAELRAKLNGAAAESVAIRRGEAGWQLDQAGKLQRLPASANATFTDLRATGEGWVAAAVENRADGDRLLLLRGKAANVEALATPAVAPKSRILQPNALVQEGALAGLVWIEGVDSRQGAVRFARFTGEGWAAAESIAAPGPGTQTALRAATLDDGSFLAVWSAYDGDDDEIVFSRYDAGRWSAPQSITANGVPDITPALRAVGDGALVAWSFYDGNDYRLRVAAWQNGAFRETATFGGKGSTFPAFADTAAPLLIARQAVPAEWQVAEFDEQGRLLRQTSTPAAGRQLPHLRRHDGAGVLLAWPDAKSAPVELTWRPFGE